jgi:hypothetical protein
MPANSAKRERGKNILPVIFTNNLPTFAPLAKPAEKAKPAGLTEM